MNYIIAIVIALFIILMALTTTAHAADINSLYHFGGSAALSGVMVTGGATKTQAIALTTGIGVMKELGDNRVSGEDIAADFGGAVFGAFAAEYLKWEW